MYQLNKTTTVAIAKVISDTAWHCTITHFAFVIHTHSTLEDRPTLRQLQMLQDQGKAVKVISTAASKWEDIAIAMGLELNIQKICRDTNSVDEACRSVFMSWLEGNTSTTVSWDALLECLEKAELSALANDIRCVRNVQAVA